MAEPDPSVEDFYDDFWASGSWGNAEPNEDERSRIEALDRLIGAHNLGGAILDVGCGRGVLTSALSRHGSIVGIDVVEAGIRRGQALFPDLDLRHIPLAELNAESAGSFDLVVSSEVIEHVASIEQPGFVAEITRALRDGGHALITTPRGELHELWRTKVSNEQPTEDWVSETALTSLLHDAGLEIVERRRAVVYPLSAWRRALCISPTRKVVARFPALRQFIDRAGIYQVVLARKNC